MSVEINMAGNWKMNKTTTEAREFAKELRALISGKTGDVKVVICAPFTAIATLTQEFDGSGIAVGAQNMHYEASGTWTGEISASQLLDLGVEYVILGHSERREKLGETDEFVNKKIKAALAAGLTPFVCVGDTLKQRQDGQFEAVVGKQIEGVFDGISADDASKCIVAYEPLWAISKGVVLEGGASLVATPEVANESCGFVRSRIEHLYGAEIAQNMTIQYGGSMASTNSASLLSQEHINGGLIGGASLNAEEFANTVLNVCAIV